MRFNVISVAVTALAFFSQQALAQESCQSTADCIQNCGGFADKLCRLPGNICECIPY
ncbi:hypothetical protein BDP55DRAFT_728786 [Colletotrichum godetiae]|uniref:Uncharacterized protein n=1 Tax=Colletotrichum godetiae TaxID=1209918 RepID=A0AAJ0ALM1_9PEZI|nr:uncharacterized protein BDP55DRAFT_728786 [Colletotrichum godetiae]KAK1675485.1 hypothetical protein BDP55DRAFT_728786 [Colletotrichum godetiae]